MSETAAISEPKESPKKAPKAPKLWRDVAEHRAKHGGQLKPDPENPYCIKCKLHEMGCRRPLEPWGSENPVITVAFDSVGYKEDDAGLVACEGSVNGLIRKTMSELAKAAKFNMEDVRWLPLSRCANRTKGAVNYKTKVGWCRSFAVDDLRRYPPRMILAIGTTALGALSHKSNAQDWSGKLLTWRGWPDDWITDNRYLIDHPTGPRPPDDLKLPLWAVQTPRLIYGTQNQRVIATWRNQLKRALEVAGSGIKLPDYDRKYYRIIIDPTEAAAALDAIPANVKLSYDTETTGLLPFIAGAKIVTHMFRYTDKDGNAVAFGLPWDFEGSPLLPYLDQLRPKLLAALYRSLLQGHNIPFDILFVYATEKGADLRKLTDAIALDTRHLAYCVHQSTESLGLELLAYSWCPELAGYEEEFVMLKERADIAPKLDPAMEEGGHYANALLLNDEKAHKAFKIYVMGDTEVVHVGAPRIRKVVDEFKTFKIPLSDPNNLGTFRRYAVPPVSFVYDKLMLPAQRTLTRMMGRGMYINPEELATQEDLFPKLIIAARKQLREVDEQVVKWCEQQEATVPDWKLDLESRDQLKTILFTILRMPVKRLTDKGDKLYGDINNCPDDKLFEFAAVDKFTLTSLVAENPKLAPLKEYRKLHKAYTMFVRSMRNIRSEGVDKHERTKYPYLMPDQCVHTSFNQCGTSSGRLASRAPNLQQLNRDSIIKRLFGSRFGKEGCIYQFDLSQIELRLLAATCGDPTMVKAYKDKIDLHSLTTSRVFKIPYEHFEKSYMAWLQEKGRVDEAKQLSEKRAIGKCVDPDTLVSVNGKICRISSLHPGRDRDTFYPVNGMIQVGDHDVRLKSVYSNGVADRLLVCSRQGLVVCSKSHRLLTKTGELVAAQDLKPGMVLCDIVPLKSGSNSDVEIPFDPFGTAALSNQFKIHVDENFAYFLGLFYGDGCSSSSSVSICFGGKPEFFKWQDKVVECLERVGFDVQLIRTCSKSADHPDWSGGKAIFGSKRVSDMLVQVGAVEDSEKRSRSHRIPEWLFNSSYEIKRAFLAGLADTDGSAYPSGYLNLVCTKWWRMAQDVSVLARSCGITHSFSPSWNKTYSKWYFEINVTKRDSYKHFSGHLRHPEKSARLSKPKFLYKKEHQNEVQQIIPLDPGHLLDVEVDSEDHLYSCNGITCHNTSNFLTGYGGGAFGLQNSLAEEGVYLDIEECERIVDAMFDTYPALRTYIGIYKRFILDHGCAVSVFGRVRPLEDAYSDDHGLLNKALRSGFNHLIQSTASDLMLSCCSILDDLFLDNGLESMLVSTVHDSIVIDAKRNELPLIHDLCSEVINNMPAILPMVFGNIDLSWMSVVDIEGDAEVGQTYWSPVKVTADPATKQVDWDRLLNTAAASAVKH